MRNHALLLGLLLAVMLLLSTPARGQANQPYWAAAEGTVPGSMLQTLVFDDGGGPAIYILSSTGSKRIYRWRAGQWDLIAAAGMPGFSANDSLFGLFVLDLDGARSLYLVGIDAVQWLDPGNPVIIFFAYIHDGWIKRWNGNGWVPAPEGLVVDPPMGDSFLQGWPVMSVDLGDGPRVYGKLKQSPTSSGYDVTQWTGDDWKVIGRVNAFGESTLVPFDDGNGLALYAFGEFTTINGMPAKGFAKWDGERWHAPYSGLVSRRSSEFNCVTFDDGSGPALYCANGGGWINGQEPGFLNKWDGNTWSIIPSVIVPPKTLTTINGIAVFDDGRGPALYITGGWGNVQGVAASGIARFDGTTWEPLGADIPYPQHGPRPNSLQVMNDPRRGPSLFVGATRAGAGVVPKYAQWVGCPNCYADCDLDRALTVADFVCFMNMYAAKDPYANCTVDATIDIADFTCFQAKFAAGCGP